MPEKPDTLNKFVVAVQSSGQIAVLNAPLQARESVQSSGQSMSRWPAIAPLSPDEALNLAAWLVALTGRRAEFDRLLDAIVAERVADFVHSRQT